MLVSLIKAVVGLFYGDSSEKRVFGNKILNKAISIGTEAGDRNALIITKIYGGKDGIDGNFLADFYVGTNNDTTRHYSETFYTEQCLRITELKKFDVYAGGENKKEIAKALSPFVH